MLSKRTTLSELALRFAKAPKARRHFIFRRIRLIATGFQIPIGTVEPDGRVVFSVKAPRKGGGNG